MFMSKKSIKPLILIKILLLITLTLIVIIEYDSDKVSRVFLLYLNLLL